MRDEGRILIVSKNTETGQIEGAIFDQGINAMAYARNWNLLGHKIEIIFCASQAEAENTLWRLQNPARTPALHRLNVIPPDFNDIFTGRRNFDCRWNDINYQVGDTLKLMEWLPESQELTGNVVWKEVSYIFKDWQGLQEGAVILGLTDLQSQKSKNNE